jgi:hypothetical protein
VGVQVFSGDKSQCSAERGQGHFLAFFQLKIGIILLQVFENQVFEQKLDPKFSEKYW